MAEINHIYGYICARHLLDLFQNSPSPNLLPGPTPTFIRKKIDKKRTYIHTHERKRILREKDAHRLGRFDFGQYQTVLNLTKFIDKYINIYNTKLVSSYQ